MTEESLETASPEYEAAALELFRGLKFPPEEFAARFGHEFAMFSFHEYSYRHPGMNAWVQELAKIFFAENLPQRLRQLRERYLTPEEIAAAEAYEKNPF